MTIQVEVEVVVHTYIHIYVVSNFAVNLQILLYHLFAIYKCLIFKYRQTYCVIMHKYMYVSMSIEYNFI